MSLMQGALVWQIGAARRILYLNLAWGSLGARVFREIVVDKPRVWSGSQVPDQGGCKDAESSGRLMTEQRQRCCTNIVALTGQGQVRLCSSPSKAEVRFRQAFVERGGDGARDRYANNRRRFPRACEPSTNRWPSELRRGRCRVAKTIRDRRSRREHQHIDQLGSIRLRLSLEFVSEIRI